ncbi:MAG: hypothetical protein HY751_07715 [Nitrospinae bacterium]|nr:hypothetical protein [Nitrospinota bacterium]
MTSVAGISNVMPAKSLKSFASMAQSATNGFIANGRQINNGASGSSRISIKA